MIRTLYKAEAPFMEVKRGYGYQGVVMYDDIEDKVQCHICGKFYMNLGQHSYMKHKIYADDYKLQYGLTLRTALCGVGYLQNKRIKTIAKIAAGEIRPGTASDAARMNKTNRRRGFKYKQNGTSLMQKNKNGLCALQIMARYQVVKEIVGKEPTQTDILKHDKKLFGCGIVPIYGNLNNFRKKIGVKEKRTSEYFKKSDIVLIAALRKTQNVTGRLPRTSDFNGHRENGMPGFKSFYRAFGSWSNALRSAGLK